MAVLDAYSYTRLCTRTKYPIFMDPKCRFPGLGRFSVKFKIYVILCSNRMENRKLRHCCRDRIADKYNKANKNYSRGIAQNC